MCLSRDLLEVIYENQRRFLLDLVELREKYPINTHFVSTFKAKGKKIIEVLCNCGEVTKYKKPLNVITDFKCPKDRGK